MKLSLPQKARVILIVNFAILFFFIIFTPKFIRGGAFWFTEETVEAIFLTVELLALISVFRHYDHQMKKQEEQAIFLSAKLEKKERELLNAFEYLGRVNVQISLIKGLLEKIRIPSSRGQLKEMYMELLRIVCNAAGEKCAMLRIINLQTGRILSEHHEIISGKKGCAGEIKIGSNELVEFFRNKKKKANMVSNHCIYYSEIENFFIKAFIFVPAGKNKYCSEEEKRLFETVAGQCEIMFLLFNSRYYKAE